MTGLILIISAVITTAILYKLLYWFFENFTSYDIFKGIIKEHSLSKTVYKITAEQAIKAIEVLIGTGEAAYSTALGARFIYNKNSWGRHIYISEYTFDINGNYYTFSFLEYCKYKKYFDEKLQNKLTGIINLKGKEII